MNLIRIIASLAFLICFSFFNNVVSAEIKAGSYELSPHAGGYVFEGDQRVYDRPVYGIGLGYNYTERFGVEAVFDYVETKDKANGRMEDGYIFHIDGLYHFMPDSKLVPYVAAGLGAITLDTIDESNATRGLFNYGAGLKYFITERLALRGDVRHIIDFDDPNSNMSYTLGLNFLFGGKEPPPPPKPKDSDGDGVYDDMDICPNTPSGASVDKKGCPLDSDRDGVYDYMDKCPGTPEGASVDKKGCPLDSDRDGVYDYMDKCPGTPEGAPVDKKGCPLDSDRDGVYDYMDKCPGTPAGVKVDTRGCPIAVEEKVSIELQIEFDTDKAVIRPMYHGQLSNAAKFLKQYPNIPAVIEGHTDSSGSEKHNQTLSIRRANAVRQYLIDNFGIDSRRLSAKGYGESSPIADNKTREGRQKNRRVLAVISGMAIKN